MVEFHLYDVPKRMTLYDFCDVCKIPFEGSVSEPRPRDMEDFIAENTVGEERGVSEARVASLHFTVLRYYSLFTGRCLIGRCRGLGATYAKGWLIMVGASITSPVPGNGMRRRHARRRILPSFRALGEIIPLLLLYGVSA